MSRCPSLTMYELIFVILFAGLACGSFAQQEVQPQPDPLSAAFQQVLSGQAGIEALCPPLCGGTCMVLKQTCVNIRGVVDCDARTTECEAACANLCGCLDGCPTECEEDCDIENVFLKYLCNKRVGICEGICQARCPVDFFSKKIMESINQSMQAIQMLLASSGIMVEGGSQSR